MTSKKLVFYTLVVNASLGYEAVVFKSMLFPSPYNTIAINTKKELDEVLLDYFGKQTQEKTGKDFDPNKMFEYDISYQGYPVSTQRVFKNFDFFSMRGSFFFYMPIAISFLIIVTEINYEKDKGIKMFLVSAGMKSGAYWMSWHLVNAIISSYIGLSITLTCKFFAVKLFQRLPFPLMFMLFFSSAFGMNSIGYVINSLCPSKELRQAAAYGFLLISFFFQIFFSAPNSCNIFYSENFASWLIYILKIVLVRYPGFNYTKIFADYVHISGNFFDTSTFKFSEGRDYTYGDFFSQFEGYLPNGVYFCVPSAFQAFVDLTLNVFCFCFIAWYFDNVLDRNQGISKGKLFCLKKKEYFGRTRIAQRTLADQQYETELDDTLNTSIGSDAGVSLVWDDREARDTTGIKKTALVEKELVKQRYGTNFQGIICKDVKKVYKSSTGCFWQSKMETQALRGVNISAEKGELITILGQNGAGKTTLVNILSGYMTQTQGMAKMFGLDVKTQLDEIRDIVSLCPQFDIFWDDLTVYEHLELIYQIKGLDQQEKHYKLTKTIEEIKLKDKRDSKISELSGGMRRRVSIGMSIVREPEVLFLDEPTTGLDPINQKEIVTLLQNIKQNRVIILVTHLMEEAEILSDKVVIMHKGEVVGVGNPLELKQYVAHPFKINVTLAHGREADLEKIFENHGIKPNFIHRGNHLTINAESKVIKDFLRLIKLPKSDRDSLEGIVINWDIGTASLEELFLEVTRDAGDRNQ